ncbi:MAG: hypothetical protein L6R35_001759 [Caloplaca aegaea]|nr:MAG: hypothetical protein L6R35_001759 [Caloplaca aegaea]
MRVLTLDSVLNTLQLACHSQPPPTGSLPLSPSQVFSLTTPSPPSTTDVGSTTLPNPEEKGGGGLSWNAKVAIAISVPVAALLISSLLCLGYYVHRTNRRRRSRKHLIKSSSHRSHRSHQPKSKAPPGHLRYNQHHPPHPGHRKVLSAGTAASEKDAPAHTFNRPFTFPDSPIHEEVTYPAPLRTPIRTRTTPSPHPTFKTHSSTHTTQALGHPTTSPRAKLPSHLTTAPSSPPPTSSSLSPPPLNIRPPPPPRGLVSWEERGVHHARTKSLRDSMRGSGESGQTATTERVKVAMQIPKGANISEWKEGTRTPTPVTIMEEGPAEHEDGRALQVGAADSEGPAPVKDEEPETLRKPEVEDNEWRRGVGSV